jgi:hypothetical protein
MARTNILPFSGFAPAYPDDIMPIDLPVASGYAGADIYPGDPLLGLTDGTLARTPAGSAAGAATDGITAICVDILQYRNSAGIVVRNGLRYLPSGTTYTADADRSTLLVILATENTIFRVKGNAANASITVARALGFINADHAYSGADQGLGLSGAVLNISTAAVTNTLQWRVLKWEDLRPSNDPTQTNFTALVVPNLIYALPIKGHSATGI